MKTSRSRFGAISALATVALLFGACSGAATPAPASAAPAASSAPASGAPAASSAAANGLKICFIHEDLETEFWLAAHKAMTETLKAQGYDVLERYGADANAQLTVLKDCIAQGSKRDLRHPEGWLDRTDAHQGSQRGQHPDRHLQPPAAEQGWSRDRRPGRQRDDR